MSDASPDNRPNRRSIIFVCEDTPNKLRVGHMANGIYILHGNDTEGIMICNVHESIARNYKPISKDMQPVDKAEIKRRAERLQQAILGRLSAIQSLRRRAATDDFGVKGSDGDSDYNALAQCVGEMRDLGYWLIRIARHVNHDTGPLERLLIAPLNDSNQAANDAINCVSFLLLTIEVSDLWIALSVVGSLHFRGNVLVLPDGNEYPIASKTAENAMRKLMEANGGFVTLKTGAKITRWRDVIKALPIPVRSLIKLKPGPGGGARLKWPEKLNHN